MEIKRPESSVRVVITTTDEASEAAIDPATLVRIADELDRAAKEAKGSAVRKAKRLLK